MKFEDLTGLRFGSLTVVERTTGPSKKHTYWRCVCDCGAETVVASQKLKSGSTKSCGCYVRSVTTVHGDWDARLYKIWKGMKSRCYLASTPAFARYGARGIVVCDDWLDYPTFKCWALANGYRDDLTIDRIDYDGNYEPSNCRWVDMKTQSNNTSTNHRVEYNGEVHTISEWAEIYGIHKNTLSNRILRGWPVERALTEPVHKK